MAESGKSIGESNYEQFADRYAALAVTKTHNAHYERPATRSLVPEAAGQHPEVHEKVDPPGNGSILLPFPPRP